MISAALTIAWCVFLSAVTPAGAAEVLWDVTHGVYFDYEPAGRFSDLVELLSQNGFHITTTDAGIDQIDLSPYAILVLTAFSCYDTPYTAGEATAAMSYATNGGSILFIGDDAGVWPDHFNPIAEPFGTRTGIMDVTPADVFVDNLAAHPIFDGIDTLYFRAAGELTALASTPVAWAPTGETVITVVESPRVATLGDGNAFENDYFASEDNMEFAANLFAWLHPPTPVGSVTWGRVKATALAAMHR